MIVREYGNDKAKKRLLSESKKRSGKL